MDFSSLRDQVSQLSLYDVKAGIRKVQNAVMNYTEMEAKVREATNNEPWGASSTAMQEIANATFNYQLLNEIMPMIYKRFTEKSAEEWRQIYKALQLLEFLIKHGSERVIDDARSHLSLLKMLRQFHFIDQNGKDQGINVRNRSKELCDLLSDVDRIRTERKKAKTTKSKYSGVEGGTGLGMGGGSSGSSSRYGGFGSESAGYGANFGGARRNVYGDGGGFGGEGQDEYDEGGNTGRSERFDEYDEYDDGGAQAPASRRKQETASSAKKPIKKAEPPKPKEPEVDLFDFGEADQPSSIAQAVTVLPPPHAATSTTLMAPADDDDFDDFQSAEPTPASAPAMPTMSNIAATPALPKPNYASFSTTQYAQPSPQPGTQQANFTSLLATRSPTASGSATPSNASNYAPLAAQPKPSGYQPAGPNYFGSVQAPASQQSTGNGLTKAPTIGGAQVKKPAGSDAFANLLAGSGMKKSGSTASKGLTIADMAKQKSQAGLYGANAPSAVNAMPASNGGKSSNDLLG